MTKPIYAIQPAPVQFAGKLFNKILATGAFAALPFTAVMGGVPSKAQADRVEITAPQDQQQPAKEDVVKKAIELINSLQQTQKLPEREAELLEKVKTLLNTLSLAQKGEIELSNDEVCQKVNELRYAVYQLTEQLVRDNPEFKEQLQQLQKQLNKENDTMALTIVVLVLFLAMATTLIQISRAR